MTLVDIVPLLLILVYAVGGFFSGLIRRFIGLIALFVAVWAATNMGIQAGGILQQTSSFEIADGRVYGFFGIIAAVLLIVEVATQLAHSQIQIPAVVLNRTLGTVVGVFTAILLSYIVVYELGAAAPPRSSPRRSWRPSFVVRLRPGSPCASSWGWTRRRRTFTSALPSCSGSCASSRTWDTK